MEHENTTLRFVYYNDNFVKFWKNDGVDVFYSGADVTYYVDKDVSHAEFVTYGQSCLTPTTFTPSKDGWEFVGWREDTTAEGSVLNAKTMGTEPITLYAVFRKACEAKFVSYGSTQTVSDYAYYNNGNKKYFTGTAPTGAAYSGWTWRGWSTSGATAANAVVGLNNGSTFNCGDDASNTFYGLYQKTCRLYCKSSGSTQTVSDTAYYNSAGNTKNAVVTAPTGAAHGSWTWRGWSGNRETAANAAVYFANGESIDIGTIDGMEIYGLYQITLYLYAYINRTKYTANSGVAYYNVAGTSSYPTVTYPNPTLSGATFNGWSVTAGSAAITYGSLANGIQLTSHLTVYAVFKYADPAMQEQSHSYDREGSSYGETYDDAPYYVTLTMPSTAGSMTVTAYGYSGPSEEIWVNGINCREDGVWKTIGTYTANTTVTIIYGYAVNCRVVFRKTYVGKTIVG